jgi:hypothetical protein
MVVNDDYPLRGVRKVPQKADRPVSRHCALTGDKGETVR